MTPKSKNDIAWETIFSDHHILDEINKNGFYKIKSSVINKYRESRLMAKYDHEVNLPKIFIENNLSILPISRYEYIIGIFTIFQKVQHTNELDSSLMSFPEYIQTLDTNNIHSESTALHCAYISKMLDHIAGEETQLTLSGRMTTDNFSFDITSIETGNPYHIEVNNAQCEIDAGFESENKLILVEAKNYEVDDFNIRQLYYPYRFWKSKVDKEIIPVLLTYSNDVFSFFVYEFNEVSNYNSIRLIDQKRYTIGSEFISLEDIVSVIKTTSIIEEPEVPFPQADRFERVVDIIGLIFETELSREDITSMYQFDVRQTGYYTNAAIYLGLVRKHKNPETKEILYSLSDIGRDILKMRYKQKYLSLARLIIQHKIFREVIEAYLSEGHPPSLGEVTQIMNRVGLLNVQKDSSTVRRRAQTVLSWINWILNLKNDGSVV